MIESAWFNFLNDALLVVVPIYALRTLHLQPAALGTIIACGSVGALLGAVLAGKVARRVGIGRAMGYGMLCACLAYLGIPLANGSRATVIALLFLCYAAYGAGMAIFNVHSLSLRQSLVPNSIMGRVVASYRLVSWAAIPVGGVLGGVFAGILGSRPTLMVTGSALVVGAVVFLRSRVAAVHDLDSVQPSDRLQDPRELQMGTITSQPPAPAVLASSDGDIDGGPAAAD
jgi:MFS family permease